MKIHPNAKTTPRMRQMMVRRVRQGWTYQAIAEALDVSQRTVAKRLARGWRQISAALGVPRSTVTRVLARAQLNRVALLEPPPVVTRYEWPHAGDLLHVDMKRLGRIHGVGHRIHGDRRRRARKDRVDAFPRGCLIMNNLFDIHS